MVHIPIDNRRCGLCHCVGVHRWYETVSARGRGDPQGDITRSPRACVSRGERTGDPKVESCDDVDLDHGKYPFVESVVSRVVRVGWGL